MAKSCFILPATPCALQRQGTWLTIASPLVSDKEYGIWVLELSGTGLLPSEFHYLSWLGPIVSIVSDYDDAANETRAKSRAWYTVGRLEKAFLG